MRHIGTAAVLFGCACAFAQEASLQEYFARVEALQRDGAAIAQQIGRDALIQQYRDLIAANPGNANNIRLETQIAMLYESDFTDQGLPPDTYAAHQVYQSIIADYDPDHPYMATVRKLGADRAAEFDPNLAQGMYEGILTDYPDEDALVVQTQYAMGQLAADQGDPAAAENYFGQVIAYAPSGAHVSEAEAANIKAYQESAAASMLSTAIAGADTPQERLKALKKFLEKHQELEAANAELVQRFAQAIERGAGRSSNPEEGNDATVEALLASLKKNKPDDRAVASRRERERAREERARDVEEEKAKLARADTVTGAAFPDTGAPSLAHVERTSEPRTAGARASSTSRIVFTVGAVCFVSIAALAASMFVRAKAR
ncbi:MAG: hypothetical protein HUU46_22725 [Candidatus Hydrogenedentes bacterium]|nr:hypothetical protein [Candidatus Hydrogenedentota bacterium]